MPLRRTNRHAPRDRLDELYWQSDRNIDEIVQELHLHSDLLDPRTQPPSGDVRCDGCARALVVASRTRRAVGVVWCPSCSGEIVVVVRGGAAGESPDPAASGGPGGNPARAGWTGRWGRWRRDVATVSPQRLTQIGGAAAIGTMAGVAAVKAVRR